MTYVETRIILKFYQKVWNNRQWKVEKVGGAKDCYLRGLSLSRGSGGMPPQEIKYCLEIEFGGIWGQKSII